MAEVDHRKERTKGVTSVREAKLLARLPKAGLIYISLIADWL